MLRFSGAGVSDVGLVRPHNEDSAFVGPYVAVVADGVGGAAAGEVASATATYAVAGDRAGPLRRAARGGARRRHRGGPGQRPARRPARPDPARDGDHADRGRLRRRRAVLGHLGDSRAYLLRDGTLTQLSTDHTYVQHLVETGQLDRAEALRHPWRNVVLRTLDGDPVPRRGRPGAGPRSQPGDRLLLCSDGLTDLVPDPTIAELLRTEDPQSAAAVLTQAALAAGGRDNVTAVVLDVVDGPRGRRRRASCSARSRTSPTSSTRRRSVRALTVGDSPRMGNVKRPALEGTVAVRGDRRLSFAEYGPRRGPAIIWMHGTPGARRQIPLEAREYADRQGVRIIGIDRPGIGSSTPYLYPDVLDWTRDLELVLDTLARRHGPGDRALRRRARTRWPPARRCRTGCTASASSAAWRPTRGADAADGGIDPARRAPRAAARRRPGCRSASRSPRPSGWSGRWPGRPRPVRRRAAARGTRTCSRARSSRRCSSTTCSTAAGSRPRRALNDLVLFTRHWGFEAADVRRAGALVARRRRPHRAVPARRAPRRPAARRDHDGHRRGEPPRRARHRRGGDQDADGARAAPARRADDGAAMR